MNPIAIFIAAALLGEYILNIIADILNLRTLHQPLPAEFREVFSEDQYKTSQEYTRTRLRFGIASATVNLILTMGFWFLGGFNWLDQLVRSYHLGAPWDGLLYIGILLLVRSICSLPFSMYSTFVIEKRFGFNTTTPALFVADLLKGLFLGILLGGPLLAGILLFFEWMGPSGWLYCWFASVLFMLTVQFIAPAWIMPLFNKFIPLADGELRSAIMRYARSVNFALEKIYIIDGSKRSTKANAFFTGFGRNKRVALYDTLVQRQSVPELVAVLAHEVGHYKRKHILLGMLLGILHSGLIFFLLSLFLENEVLFDAFGVEAVSVYGSLVFFGIAFSPIEFLIGLAMHALTRKHEFEADRFAVETVDTPSMMSSALKKLSVDNLSHLTPHPFYVALRYSHPPLINRLRAIELATRPR